MLFRSRWALGGFTIAALVTIFLFSSRGPTPEEEQILGYVQMGFQKKGAPILEEKDWTGPKEVFREIASKDNVITPKEMHEWARKRGFRLPSPR